MLSTPALLSTDGEIEVTNFVRACEAVQGMLALRPEDRDLIEYSCIDLLNKLRSPGISSP